MLPAEGIVFLRDFCVYSSERYSGARHGKPATLRRASIYACRVKTNNRFCGKTVSINADPTEESCILCLPCKGRWHGESRDGGIGEKFFEFPLSLRDISPLQGG